MTKFTREEKRAWRCHEGHYDAEVTGTDGTKRCAYCGFPLTPDTASKDVLEALERIFGPSAD